MPLPSFLLSREPEPATAKRPAPQTPAVAGQVQSDKERLYELEKGVRAHRLSWVQAGASLAEINSSGVYRVIYASFEEYLQRRWGFSKKHGYDLITAAGVAENVRAVKHALSVRAAVVLAKLDAGQQAECLSHAIAGSGTRSPTADYLRAAVAARLGSKVQSRKSKVKKKPKPVRITLGDGVVLTILANKSGDLCEMLERALAQLRAQGTGNREQRRGSVLSPAPSPQPPTPTPKSSSAAPPQASANLLP